MIGDLIKIKVEHSHTLFPKYPQILGECDNNFGIVKWNVLDVLEGELDINDFSPSVTITGMYETAIIPKQEYTIIAKENYHEKYGKQYELIYIGENVDLSTKSAQIAFMKSFLTEGQISELYKLYDDPLKIIANHDIEKLKKVYGIGDYISNAIIDRYENCKDYSVIYSELDRYGLTPAFIQKLIKQYKNPQKVINIVQQHPYQLCEDVDGIGFKTADEIALKFTFSPKSVERIEAYIIYKLTELGENGDSFITSAELNYYLFNELGSKDEIFEVFSNEDKYKTLNNISEAIQNLIDKDILFMEDNEEKTKRRIYLKRFYNLELDIANELARISKAPNSFKFDNWEQKIAHQERIQGWTLTEQQYKGVQSCLENQITFITGGAGTGKTSVLSCALMALGCTSEKPQYTFAQCSLSGKAAARMTEVTGAEGYTIHRLLGYRPPNSFFHGKDTPLTEDIVIVDEISLVGGEIFLSLLKAIKTGAKLIMLGDMGQLESIGCLNLAKDLYESEPINVIELDKIHRQAQKSGIILLSQDIRHSINNFSKTDTGETILGELQDMRVNLQLNKEAVQGLVMKYYKQYFINEPNLNVMDIQILAPVKERGDACVYQLNQLAQEFINPSNAFKAQVFNNAHNKKYMFQLRENDKVMCVKNNYSVFGYINDVTESIETPVFNGWTGIIKKIILNKQEIHIYFPIIKTIVIFPFEKAQTSLTLGYASTIHKFQGSSAKYIIGCIDYSTPPFMRTKELLYTLVTRAEKHCTLVAQRDAYFTAIQNSGVTNKNTFLKELIEERL